MDKYEKAHKFIDFLKASGYEGQIRVSIEEHTFKMIDGIVPKESKVITQSRIPVPEKQIRANTGTSIEGVEWARGGGRWSNDVKKALYKLGVNSIEILEDTTPRELKLAGISDRFVEMIQEGLGTIDKHLLGAPIIKRK